MQLTVIGSGTAVPQTSRSAPCHLLRAGDEAFILDLGPGSIWGLLRQGGITLQQVGTILLSHLHLDHCADLAPLLFALRSGDLRRTRPLEVIGPKGLFAHYRALQDIWEHRIEPEGFDLRILEWAGVELRRVQNVLRAAPTFHSQPNLGWRVDPRQDDRCGLLYTGDGEPTRDLVGLARSGDHVLLAECASAPGRLVPGHMNPAQAGDLARVCGSRKLVLCHINPGTEPDEILAEAMAHYEGEVVVAEDGMEIEIP